MTTPHGPDAGFDFFDPGLWEQRVPVEEFAALRRTAPIWWNAQTDDTNLFRDGGIWAISKHEHIKAIARDTDAWSTNANGFVPAYPQVSGPDAIEASKALLVNHDPPAHTRLRKIVSRLFTPRSVTLLEDKLRHAATEIVRQAASKDSGEFVEDVAAILPIEAIADLIGVPQADREQVFHWANSLITADDEEARYEEPLLASAQFFGYAHQMAEDRRRNPRDDIVTLLVNADIDGQSLTELEFAYFVLFLAVAGNETVRNATAQGMNAFLDHPDQWALFKRLRPPTTADEIIRFTSPAVVTQRTANRDAELAGVTIKQGQRAGLFYGSANFDEDIFVNPTAFDITRAPNPHLGFGGNGPHICLGASLARLELRLIFDAIADVMPDIEKADEPRRLRSSLVNGIKRLDVLYH